jgi:hypothetical protein
VRSDSASAIGLCPSSNTQFAVAWYMVMVNFLIVKHLRRRSVHYLVSMPASTMTLSGVSNRQLNSL